MKKFVAIIGFIALFVTCGIAENSSEDLKNDVTNKAIDIGISALSGLLSGKKTEQIVEESKKQVVEAAQDTANKKLNDAKQ